MRPEILASGDLLLVVLVYDAPRRPERCCGGSSLAQLYDGCPSSLPGAVWSCWKAVEAAGRARDAWLRLTGFEGIDGEL